MISASCASCGTRLTGVFCSACGQRVLGAKHSLRSLVAGAVARLFNLEQGLVNTAYRLTVDPGVVIRDYLSGRTVPYTHPFTYLVLAVAAFALSARVSGAVTGGDNRALTALLVLFLAAASRMTLRRRGLNYAEHLILNIYLAAHAVLLLVAAQLALLLAPDPIRMALAVVALVGTVGYFAWGYGSVFPERPVLAAGAGLASLALGVVLWLAALAVVLNLFRAW